MARTLVDFGINDDFMKKLGNTIPSGSSALFVLIRSVTDDAAAARDVHGGVSPLKRFVLIGR